MSFNNSFFLVIKENLDNGIDVSFLPQGDSMLPLIRGGKDRVFLDKIDENGFKVGDIVLFSFNGLPVLHRIVRIKNDIIMLKGDGNYREEYCNISDIIAKVRYIQRGKYNIYRDSFIWRVYILLWPENKFFRRFFLFLYKFLRKYNENFK